MNQSAGAEVKNPGTKLGVHSNSFCPSALAPMQDVTGLPFMTLISKRGEPDIFFTEFFRVHANSRLDPAILSSLTQNPTNRPVFAQIIGGKIPVVVTSRADSSESRIASIAAAIIAAQ